MNRVKTTLIPQLGWEGYALPGYCLIARCRVEIYASDYAARSRTRTDIIGGYDYIYWVQHEPQGLINSLLKRLYGKMIRNIRARLPFVPCYGNRQTNHPSVKPSIARSTTLPSSCGEGQKIPPRRRCLLLCARTKITLRTNAAMSLHDACVQSNFPALGITRRGNNTRRYTRQASTYPLSLSSNIRRIGKKP